MYYTASVKITDTYKTAGEEGVRSMTKSINRLYMLKLYEIMEKRSRDSRPIRSTMGVKNFDAWFGESQMAIR